MAMRKSKVKEEVLSALTPVFGEKVRKTVDEFYSEKEEKALYDVAFTMLAQFAGPMQARLKLEKAKAAMKH